jgi:hypothetical protein
MEVRNHVQISSSTYNQVDDTTTHEANPKIIQPFSNPKHRWQSVVHVRDHETILLKLRSKQDNQSVKRRKFDSDEQLINICMK